MATLSDVRFKINHKNTRWLAAGALGLVTAMTVLVQLKDLQASRAELGQTVPVLVAANDIAAGSLLDDTSLQVEDRPLAHIPKDALIELPAGVRLRSSVSAGEVLTATRLAGVVSGTVAAQIPSGTVGVAIPLDPTQLGVEQGDQIALYRANPGQLAVLVAASAAVIAINEDSLVAAVQLNDLGNLLDGLILGDVVPVLLPVSPS